MTSSLKIRFFVVKNRLESYGSIPFLKIILSFFFGQEKLNILKF